MDIETQAEASTPLIEADAPVRRRRRLVAAVVAVVALAAGAWWVVSVARADTAAKTEAFLAEAAGSSAQWSTTRDELVAAIEHASALLDESKDRIADPAVLDNLATAIDEATTLIDQPHMYGDEVGVSGDGGLWVPLTTTGLREARQAAEDAAAAVDDQAQAAANLAAAVTAVEESRAAFDLAEAAGLADEARARLVASIDTGEAVLSSTDGRVLDNAVRAALRSTLDAAIAVRDAAVDTSDVDALRAAAAALTDQVGAVDAATQAVTDATGAWQDEQDRRAKQAADDAAAADRARREAANKPASTKSANNSTQGGGTQPATPTATQGAGSTDTGPSFQDMLDDPFGDGTTGTCGDTKGNSWDC